MKNISFALTTEQIIEETKFVTRRLNWLNVREGQLLQPVKKCMGLKPGEKIQHLRGPIQVIGVRREPLRAMLDNLDYGFMETDLEGFALHPQYCWPSAFVEMFCATHKGCTPETIITRIQFRYEPKPTLHNHTIWTDPPAPRSAFTDRGYRRAAACPRCSHFKLPGCGHCEGTGKKLKN